MCSFIYFYYKRYKENNFSIFREFEFAYILYFVVLTLTMIASRGAVRLLMVLGAFSPIAVSFLIVKTSKKYLEEKEDARKLLFGVLALVIIIASLYTAWIYYQSDKATASNFAPGMYQWQWQKAMAWIRENTPVTAVFAHWWDYGYWVQSIGERATILDGGNAITYWDYLMGRYVLTGNFTGEDQRNSLEFLYSHNGTHLLIDSTDIGKYTAFSSIGADVNYDRFSWISTFLIDESQTQETGNQTTYIYTGGSPVDEDFSWNIEGKQVFFPQKASYVIAIVLQKNKDGGIAKPQAIFLNNQQQYEIPLRYLYIEGDNKLYDFGSGLDAGVFIFPKFDMTSSGSINNLGAALYLSKRTIHTNLVNLYLFNQNSDYFRLVHEEDNLLVENLKQQGLKDVHFIYYGEIQGPIKIWEIKYPSDIKTNPEFLATDYPDKELQVAKIGEY